MGPACSLVSLSRPVTHREARELGLAAHFGGCGVGWAARTIYPTPSSRIGPPIKLVPDHSSRGRDRQQELVMRWSMCYRYKSFLLHGEGEAVRTGLLSWLPSPRTLLVCCCRPPNSTWSISLACITGMRAPMPGPLSATSAERPCLASPPMASPVKVIRYLLSFISSPVVTGVLAVVGVEGQLQANEPCRIHLAENFVKAGV